MKKGTTVNEKLRKARLDRNWSHEEAAKKIGVSRTTFIRWEQGRQSPHGITMNMACDAFKMTPEQLGFKEYASKPTSTGETLAIQSSSTTDTFSVGVLALALTQRQYGWSTEELWLRVDQELRRLDTMAQHGQEEKLTRRTALRFLTGLPGAVMGLTATGSLPALPVEEVLPLYITSVPASWRLYFDGGMAEVEQMLPGSLAQLSYFALQSSTYQQVAASIASQAYQLDWLLKLQHQDFGAALSSIKQAFHFGDVARDDSLRLASLVRQAHIYFHMKRPMSQLRTHQEAEQYVSTVSPLLKGWFYVVLAESQAAVGQQEEANRSLGIARDVFPEHPERDPHFTFVPVDRFFFVNHEVITQLHLGQAKEAWKNLEQIDKVVATTIVPRRVELQCRQADASFQIGDLDQSCSYVEQAATSAAQLGSHLRYNEAYETYQKMQHKWPRERKVQALIDLFDQF